MKTFKHEASGVDLSRPLCRPNAITFKELFADSAPYDTSKGGRGHPFPFVKLTGQSIPGNLYTNCMAVFQGNPRPERNPDETMLLSPYCSVTSNNADGISDDDKGYHSLSVLADPATIEAILKGTCIIPNDSMSFQICVHGPEWSLVIARHSQIIRDVWLAYIRTWTIPGFEHYKPTQTPA